MLKSIINTLNNIVYTVQKYIHLHEHAHIQTKVEQAINSYTIQNFQQIKSAFFLNISCMMEHILIKLFKILYMYI